MSIHVKVDGAWVAADRPYVKRAGAWVPAREVYVKRAGVWVRAYEYDVTPPPAPTVTLELVEANGATSGGGASAQLLTPLGYHVKMGVSIPGGHDDEVRLIRVLTTYQGKAPTTPLGGTYTRTPDDNYPNEPWSDFQFDGVKPTNVVRYKTWTPSATNLTVLKGGETYYFTAWAQDDAGLWSLPTAVQITIPKKGVDAPAVVTKEARFSANGAGTWTGFGAGSYDYGELTQQNSPRKRGVIFYGTKISGAITGNPDKVAIKSAQIYLARKNDGGAAQANIYLGWDEQSAASGMTQPTPSNMVKLGTLGKGEAKWFDLPNSFNNPLKGTFGSVVLGTQDPAKAAAGANDFSVLKPLGDAPRQGELHVVWTVSS